MSTTRFRSCLAPRPSILFAALVLAALGAPAPRVRADASTEPPAPAPAAPSTVECPEGAALASGSPAREMFREEPGDGVRALWCERYDENGRSTREGPYLDRYASGATRTSARYEDGRLEGPIHMWHENGHPWLSARFANGVLEGPYRMTQPDGEPWYEATYRHGELEGPVRTYYPNGVLSAETPYHQGVEHGLAHTFYPDGSPKTEIAISEGVWSGVFRRWRPGGTLAAEGHYTPCAAGPDAPASCAYLGAVRDGDWKEWNAKGRLVAWHIYHGGESVAVPTAPAAAPPHAPVAAVSAAAAVDASEPRGSLER